MTLADFADARRRPIAQRIDELWRFVKDKERAGFDFYEQPLLGSNGARVIVDDTRCGGPKQMVMFASANYLGLNTHPRVIGAAAQALTEFGAGAGSIPHFSGTNVLFRKLESGVSRLTGQDAVAIFPTGYMANMACLSALAAPGDQVIADRQLHRSVLDGCRLSGATVTRFAHGDLCDLEKRLLQHRGKGSRFIVIEGVGGLDGELPPFSGVAELAKRFDVTVIIDDAQAIGVTGAHGFGSGSIDLFDRERLLITGSFSKALGGLGGFVAASREAINQIKYSSNSYLFAVSLAPPCVAAAQASVAVLQDEPWHHKRLQRNIRYFRQGLEQRALAVNRSESAIFSFTVANELRLRRLKRQLHDAGMFVEDVPFPGAPRGQERLRLRIVAPHQTTDLDLLLEQLDALRPGMLSGETKEAC